MRHVVSLGLQIAKVGTVDLLSAPKYVFFGYTWSPAVGLGRTYIRFVLLCAPGILVACVRFCIGSFQSG